MASLIYWPLCRTLYFSPFLIHVPRFLIAFCDCYSPYYIHLFLPIKLSFTSALRVLRFFRLLKFDNYTRAFGILKSVFVKEKELLLISGFYCFVALVIGASLLYATDSDVPEFVYVNYLLSLSRTLTRPDIIVQYHKLCILYFVFLWVRSQNRM
jgi:hypothetical protein